MVQIYDYDETPDAITGLVDTDVKRTGTHGLAVLDERAQVQLELSQKVVRLENVSIE